MDLAILHNMLVNGTTQIPAESLILEPHTHIDTNTNTSSATQECESLSLLMNFFLDLPGLRFSFCRSAKVYFPLNPRFQQPFCAKVNILLCHYLKHTFWRLSAQLENHRKPAANWRRRSKMLLKQQPGSHFIFAIFSRSKCRRTFINFMPKPLSVQLCLCVCKCECVCVCVCVRRRPCVCV